VTTDQALLKIAAVAAQAVAEALRTLCGPQVAPGPAKVVGDDEHPLAEITAPTVVSRVTYLDGATGGSLLAMPVPVARRIAAAMMGAAAPQDDAGELTEIEQAALDQAMSELMSAAGQAVGALLGETIEIGPPETRLAGSEAQAGEPIAEPGDHAAHVDLTVLEIPCRLVQLVPDAFVTQLTRALDETLGQHDGEPLKAALCGIPVRVWVELGRASMPLGRLIALPPGEVVDLDRDVDDPVDLYVDGMPVARGRLAVSESGEFLTLEIESLAPTLPFADHATAA